MLGNKGFEDDTNCYHILSFQIFVPFFWWISHIIYPLPVDLGPPFVDHADYFSSACPISRIPKPSISCSNQSSTVQRSFPHLCDQNVICGHLMRRWQFLLELLLHQAPMANLLCLSFFLGCSARLPLMVCRFSLLWSWFVEDRIVLDDASQQFGLSSFVIGHFFFLGVGLRLSIKWVGVAKFFDPTKDVLW